MKENASVALAAGMVVVFVAFGGGRSGKVVDPAEFGFSPDAAPEVNAAALQKALDGGKRTVRVSKPGVYGLDRNVYIDSDTTLDFAPGTVLKKMKPYQHELQRAGAERAHLVLPREECGVPESHVYGLRACAVLLPCR